MVSARVASGAALAGVVTDNGTAVSSAAAANASANFLIASSYR